MWEIDLSKQRLSKCVVRKFDAEYITFGFTETKAQCVECGEILSSEALKPSKISVYRLRIEVRINQALPGPIPSVHYSHPSQSPGTMRTPHPLLFKHFILGHFMVIYFNKYTT